MRKHTTQYFGFGLGSFRENYTEVSMLESRKRQNSFKYKSDQKT